MAGIESCFRISFFQPLSQSCQFFLCLLSIAQVETTYNAMNRPRTGCKDVLQSTMSTAREKQAIDIQSQLMTEIVVDIISVGILNIKILIPLGHRVNLRDMGNSVDTFCYLAGMVYQDESVFTYLRPLCSNAMQIASF